MRQFTRLYEVLGLDPEQEIITQDEIKSAFRKRSKEVHPDKEGGSEAAQAELNSAYSVLKDPNLRARYDATGNGDKSPEQTEVPGLALLHELLQAVLRPSSDKVEGLAQALGIGLPDLGYPSFENKDFVGELKKLCSKGRQGIEQQIKEHQNKAKALGKIIDKLTHKAKGKTDVLGGMLRAQQNSHLQAVEQGKRHLGEVDAVVALLETYDFAFTPSSPKPEQRGRSGGFMIFDDPYVPEQYPGKPNMGKSSFGQENNRYNRSRGRGK